MTLGYRQARIASDCALGTAGAVLRGHEFHYATIVAAAPTSLSPLFATSMARRKRPPAREGAGSLARFFT